MLVDRYLEIGQFSSTKRFFLESDLSIIIKNKCIKKVIKIKNIHVWGFLNGKVVNNVDWNISSFQ